MPGTFRISVFGSGLCLMYIAAQQHNKNNHSGESKEVMSLLRGSIVNLLCDLG